jgi:Caspase domain
MGRRPDRERSRLLLVGADRFRSVRLPDIDAVDFGLERLRQVLTSPGEGVFAGDREHCVILRRPRTPREIFDNFFTVAGQADDVLLVYYAGHGVLDRDGHLHLAVEETDPLQPIGNAVEFERLRRALATSPAPLRILILDCCYSGQALGRQGADADDDAETAVAQVIAEDVAEGMYVLTSSDRQSTSRYFSDERTTAFTGALLRALAARPNDEIRLGDVYPFVESELLHGPPARRQLSAPALSHREACGQCASPPSDTSTSP